MPPRKRARWDVAPTPVRLRVYGPKMPGGQQYSKSDQAQLDPRNARIYDAQRGYDRSGGFYGRFSGPGAEYKFFDTSISAPMDATGEVPATGGQLVLIPQGVTESTRVGRKACIKSIQLKGNVVFAPAASANAASTAFLYLIQDTQCNGAAAAVTDVLTNANISVGLINLANSQRFRILKKWKWSMNSTAGATTAYNNVVKTMEWYKKVNIPIEYSSTTGAITEIRSNNLFLLAGSDQASDDLITYAGTCRVRFSDT